jgi:hypothetical protein
MGLSIMIMVTIAMNLMFISIMAGMPTLVSMSVLFGGMMLGIGLLGGEATYTADESGFIQEIRPLPWFKFIPKNVYRHFRWEEIEWYRQGTDLNRSLQEYRYLKIKVNRWPYTLQITSDKADPVKYDEFEKVFMHFADGTAIPGQSDDHTEVPHPAQKAIWVSAKRRPDFYDTLLARIIFWGFTAAFIGIIFLINFTGILKGTYIFRFLFVIIPGMGYFYYRIFVKGKRTKK